MITLPNQWSPARREIHAMQPGEERRFDAKDYSSVRSAVYALNSSAGGDIWKFTSKDKACTVRRRE